MIIQKPKGTKDIYGQQQRIYQFIFDTFNQVAKNFNLQKITTPVFESYELFRSTTGDQSDIVSKEIYKFEDFGKRILALKPEGTAPVGRAIIENKLYLEKKYNKLYYIDSMFRYEKPQKGRLRQFYQIGIELINDLSVYSVLETILIATTFLNQLKISDYKLQINSLGQAQDRANYIEQLKIYFDQHKDQLSAESQRRITTNPLRILDDKIDAQLDVVKNAPQINQFWSQASEAEFKLLLKLLDQLKIDYEINYSLVRGLDYYSNIVYEFVSDSKALGVKSTLIGGGTYLDLVDSPSNPINGVGFGCGVERLFEILLAANLFATEEPIDCYFLIENESQYLEILEPIYQLRQLNYCVEFNYQIRKFKKLFQEAKYFQAKMIVFQELDQQASDLWTIKFNETKIICKQSELVEQIQDLKLIHQ